MQNSDSQPIASGRGQRRFRNFLLDRRFQLKYANLAAGIALIISVSLGALLWRVSESTLDQSRAAVELGAEVLNESRKVSEVVAMNIVRDPEYSENPALKAAFEADAKDQARVLASQHARLEGHAASLQTLRVRFASVLFVTLALLVAALWFGGIMLTHRVAGPIHKMKRQIRALQHGDWVIPSPLRRGDELTEFFDAFNDMVGALRDRRNIELTELNALIAAVEGKIPEGDFARMNALRDRMQRVLAPPSHPPPPSRRP